MPHNTYLRRLRGRWMLSQGELAELLDISQERVSRYENGGEYPSLSVALAYQVVFGRAPRTCFFAIYTAVEEAVITRAAVLDRTITGKRDAISRKKRQLLEGMMERATSRPNS
jgi:transcriptional regulator with XRE-family HTH domain